MPEVMAPETGRVFAMKGVEVLMRYMTVGVAPYRKCHWIPRFPTNSYAAMQPQSLRELSQHYKGIARRSFFNGGARQGTPILLVPARLKTKDMETGPRPG